jgi:hypothetical protein
MMLAHTPQDPTGQQRGRISVVLTMVLVTVCVGALALTFTPAGFSTAAAPSSLTAVTAAPKVMPLKTVTGASPFVAQEPLSLDHSVLNNPDLLPAPNPAPMAIAAYD